MHPKVIKNMPEFNMLLLFGIFVSKKALFLFKSYVLKNEWEKFFIIKYANKNSIISDTITYSYMDSQSLGKKNDIKSLLIISLIIFNTIYITSIIKTNKVNLPLFVT